MNDQAELGTDLAVEALVERFAGRPFVAWLEDVTCDDEDEVATVRLVEGNLRLEGDLALSASPWILVVDGDLELTGTLDCKTDEGWLSTLVVTGTLRARNVFFSTSARVHVGGLSCQGTVIGTWGDAGAALQVEQVLEAGAVLLDAQTPAHAGRFAAPLLAGAGWSHLAPDLSYERCAEQFVPEVLRDGARAAQKVARAGSPVLKR